MGAVIHGDKEQRERDWIINQFKTGRVPVLVATDVAARGLDIKDVNLVVNFDFPNQIEDYGIDRSHPGRAGAKGFSHSFIEPGEGNMARKLIPILRQAGQEVDRELEDMASRGGGGGGRGGAEGGRGRRSLRRRRTRRRRLRRRRWLRRRRRRLWRRRRRWLRRRRRRFRRRPRRRVFQRRRRRIRPPAAEFARCPASSVKMGTGTPLRRRETTRSVPRRIHITRAYTFDQTDRERALDERRAILAREELFSARRIFSRRLRDASHRPCALAMAPGVSSTP